jgi:hypothetical protein
MTLNLGQKQELFGALLPRLLDEVKRQGYAVRPKELLRTELQAEWNATHCVYCRGSANSHDHLEHRFKPFGIRQSVHTLGLAIDLVLALDGHVLWNEEAYSGLGTWWEAQHELCRWGGRFNDPGHFSLEHENRR